MKLRFKLLCFITVILLSISLTACSFPFTEGEEISFPEGEMHDGNLYQYLSKNLLTVANGKLYLYDDDGSLKVLEKGRFKQVRSFGGERIGLAEEYAYYSYASLTAQSASLYRYHISTGENVCIADWLEYGGASAVWRDGSLYVPTSRNNEYYKVIGEECGEATPLRLEYQFGDHYCYFENFQFVYEDAEGKQSKALDLNNTSLLVPYKEGLLILPSTAGQLLYYITADGEWVEFDLDSTECRYVEAALNYYEDTIYISFSRIGQQGFLGYTAYDDDTISGTYKINTKDNSVAKISDKYYTGIYVFDNEGLFVTAPSGSVYKIDFDGNVIDTILQQSRIGSSYKY